MTCAGACACLLAGFNLLEHLPHMQLVKWYLVRGAACQSRVYCGSKRRLCGTGSSPAWRCGEGAQGALIGVRTGLGRVGCVCGEAFRGFVPLGIRRLPWDLRSVSANLRHRLHLSPRLGAQSVRHAKPCCCAAWDTACKAPWGCGAWGTHSSSCCRSSQSLLTRVRLGAATAERCLNPRAHCYTLRGGARVRAVLCAPIA